jgi:hypothetical protein
MAYLKEELLNFVSFNLNALLFETFCSDKYLANCAQDVPRNACVSSCKLRLSSFNELLVLI